LSTATAASPPAATSLRLKSSSLLSGVNCTVDTSPPTSRNGPPGSEPSFSTPLSTKASSFPSGLGSMYETLSPSLTGSEVGSVSECAYSTPAWFAGL
jgi:hypothetical protein